MESIVEVMKDLSFFNLGVEKVGRKTCRICGKEYEDYKFSLSKERFAILQRPTCTCEEDEKRKNEELEQLRIKQRKEAQERANLSRRFANSLISPRFQKMSFETLDQSKNIREIAFCKQFISAFDKKSSKGILFIGKPGTGKTSLLACVCNELITQGFNCLFTTVASLLSDFTQYSSKNAGSIEEKLKWLLEFDFIVLDDVGRMTLTDKRREILFQIIDTLYNEEAIIAVTANPEMITKLKTDDELIALLDRLNAMCSNKFEFRGNSLR